MKKSIAALALALTLVGTLASCGNRGPNTDHHTGSAGNQNGVTSGSAAVPGSTAGGASGTAGTVSRRFGGEYAYNSGKYFDDGRYTAGPDGRVRSDKTGSRDLTQDARDMVRDTGDAIGDMGRDIGNAINSAGRDVSNAIGNAGRDAGDRLTGGRTVRGNETPSWGPDSSAVRF